MPVCQFLSLLFCAIMLSFQLTACSTGETMKNVSSITYTIDSGSILPELQSHSVYMITPQTLTHTTRGRSADTQISEGQWQYRVDEKVTRDLFNLAAEKHCSAYERVESADPPDGGGTESILISYSNGDSCSLYYDPGTTYRGAGELLESIRHIVRSLDPASAVTVQQP